MKSSQHYSSGIKRGVLGREGGQSLRDDVSVDIFKNSKCISQQRRSESRFTSPVRSCDDNYIRHRISFGPTTMRGFAVASPDQWGPSLLPTRVTPVLRLRVDRLRLPETNT